MKRIVPRRKVQSNSIDTSKVGADFLTQHGITTMADVYKIDNQVNPGKSMTIGYDPATRTGIKDKYIRRAKLNPYSSNLWDESLYKMQTPSERIGNTLRQLGINIIAGVTDSFGGTMGLFTDPGIWEGNGSVKRNVFERWSNDLRQYSQYSAPVFSDPNDDRMFSPSNIANIIGSSGNVLGIAAVATIENTLMNALAPVSGGSTSAAVMTKNVVTANKIRKVLTGFKNILKTNLGRNTVIGLYQGVRENYINTHLNGIELYEELLRKKENGEIDTSVEDIEKEVSKSMTERWWTDMGPVIALSIFQQSVMSRSLRRGKSFGSYNRFMKPQQFALYKGTSDIITDAVLPMFKKMKIGKFNIGAPVQFVAEAGSEGIEEFWQDGVSAYINYKVNKKLGIKTPYYSATDAIFTRDLANSFIGGVFGGMLGGGVHRGIGFLSSKSNNVDINNEIINNINTQLTIINKANNEYDALEKEYQELYNKYRVAKPENKKEIEKELIEVSTKRQQKSIELQRMKQEVDILSISDAIRIDYSNGNVNNTATETLFSTYKEGLQLIEKYEKEKDKDKKEKVLNEIKNKYNLSEDATVDIQEIKRKLETSLEISTSFAETVEEYAEEFNDLEDALTYATLKHNLTALQNDQAHLNEDFTNFIKELYKEEDPIIIEQIKHSLYQTHLQYFADKLKNKKNLSKQDRENLNSIEKEIKKSKKEINDIIEQERSNGVTISEVNAEAIISKLNSSSKELIQKFSDIYISKYHTDRLTDQTNNIYQQFEDISYRTERRITDVQQSVDLMQEAIENLQDKYNIKNSDRFQASLQFTKNRLEELKLYYDDLYQVTDEKTQKEIKKHIEKLKNFDAIIKEIENKFNKIQSKNKVHDFRSKILGSFGHLQEEDIKSVDEEKETVTINLKDSAKGFTHKFEIRSLEDMLKIYGNDPIVLEQSGIPTEITDDTDTSEIYLIPSQKFKKSLSDAQIETIYNFAKKINTDNQSNNDNQTNNEDQSELGVLTENNGIISYQYELEGTIYNITIPIAKVITNNPLLEEFKENAPEEFDKFIKTVTDSINRRLVFPENLKDGNNQFNSMASCQFADIPIIYMMSYSMNYIVDKNNQTITISNIEFSNDAIDDIRSFLDTLANKEQTKKALDNITKGAINQQQKTERLDKEDKSTIQSNQPKSIVITPKQTVDSESTIDDDLFDMNIGGIDITSERKNYDENPLTQEEKERVKKSEARRIEQEAIKGIQTIIDSVYKIEKNKNQLETKEDVIDAFEYLIKYYLEHANYSANDTLNIYDYIANLYLRLYRSGETGELDITIDDLASAKRFLEIETAVKSLDALHKLLPSQKTETEPEQIIQGEDSATNEEPKNATTNLKEGVKIFEVNPSKKFDKVSGDNAATTTTELTAQYHSFQPKQVTETDGTTQSISDSDFILGEEGRLLSSDLISSGTELIVKPADNFENAIITIYRKGSDGKTYGYQAPYLVLLNEGYIDPSEKDLYIPMVAFAKTQNKAAKAVFAIRNISYYTEKVVSSAMNQTDINQAKQKLTEFRQNVIKKGAVKITINKEGGFVKTIKSNQPSLAEIFGENYDIDLYYGSADQSLLISERDSSVTKSMEDSSIYNLSYDSIIPGLVYMFVESPNKKQSFPVALEKAKLNTDIVNMVKTAILNGRNQTDATWIQELFNDNDILSELNISETYSVEDYTKVLEHILEQFTYIYQSKQIAKKGQALLYKEEGKLYISISGREPCCLNTEPNQHNLTLALQKLDLNYNVEKKGQNYYILNSNNQIVQSNKTIRQLILNEYKTKQLIINVNENITDTNVKPKYIAVFHPRVTYKINDAEVSETDKEIEVSYPTTLLSTSKLNGLAEILNDDEFLNEEIHSDEINDQTDEKAVTEKKEETNTNKEEQQEQVEEQKEKFENDNVEVTEEIINELLSDTELFLEHNGYNPLLSKFEPQNLDDQQITTTDDSYIAHRLSEEQISKIVGNTMIEGVDNATVEELIHTIANQLIHDYLNNPNLSAKELRQQVVNYYSELLNNQLSNVNNLIDKFTIIIKNNKKQETTQDQILLENKLRELQNIKKVIQSVHNAITSDNVTEKGFNLINEAVSRFTEQLDLIEYTEEVADENQTEHNNDDQQNTSQDQIYSLNFYETNGKRTMSQQLKLAMQGVVKQGQKGLFGSNIYYSLDEIYNLVETILIEENAVNTDLNTMITALQNYTEFQPQVQVVIDMLEASRNPDTGDYKLANQFVMHFNRQFMDFLAIGFKDSKNSTEYTVMEANSNTVFRKTYNRWKNNFKTSPLLQYIDGKPIINKEILDKILSPLYENRFNEKSLSSKIEILKNIFNHFGIDLDNRTILHIAKYGFDDSKAISKSDMDNIQNDQDNGQNYKSLFSNKYNILYHLRQILLNYQNNETLSEEQIEDIFKNVNNAIKSLIELNSKYDFRVKSATVRLGGKSIYLYTNHNSTSIEINKLKSDSNYRAELKKNYFSKHSLFLQLLDDSLTVGNKRDAKNFRLHYLSLDSLINLNKFAVKPNSTKFNDLDTISQERVKIGFFQSMRNFISEKTHIGNLKTRVYQQEFPTLSDKDTIMLMDMIGVKLNYLDMFNSEGKISLFSPQFNNVTTEVFNYVYKQLIYPELERILMRISFEQVGSDISGYNFNSQFFNILPFLNTIKRSENETWLQYFHRNFQNATKEQVIEFLNSNTIKSEFKSAVAKSMENFYESQIKEQINVWLEEEIISIDENGEYHLGGFNKEYIKSLEYEKSNKNSDNTSTKQELTNEQKVKLAAIDLIINNQVGRANLAMVFNGDMALYGKDQKNVDFAKDDLTIEDFERYSQIAYDNYVKRMASELAPGQQLPIDGEIITKEYRQIIVNDSVLVANNLVDLAKIFYPNNDVTDLQEAFDKYNKEKTIDAKKELEDLVDKKYSAIEDYLNIESTDGQEWTTLSEHLGILFGQGKITKQEYEEYNEIVKRQQDKESKGQPLTQSDLLTNAQLQKLLQPIKPVVTGNTSYNGVNRKVYIKTSSFPLIPQITINNPTLNALRIAMEKIEQKDVTENATRKPVRLVFNSGIKVGALTTKLNLLDNNGNLDSEYIDNTDQLQKVLASNSITVPRDNFKIQMEVPIKDHGTVSLISQAFRTMFGDGMTEIDGFELNGKKISGQELQKMFTETYNEFLDDLYDELKKELNLESLNPKKSVEDKGKFYNAIRQLLIKEAKRRGYPTQDIEALRVIQYVDKNNKPIDVKFSQPLWSLGTGYKMESLLMSMISKKFIKTKIPGNSYVLGSSATIGRNTSDISKQLQKQGSSINRIIFTDKWDGTLHGLRIEESNGNKKIRRNQVLLPSKFNYIDENGNNVQLNLYKDDGTINTDYINSETGRLNTATVEEIKQAQKLIWYNKDNTKSIRRNSDKDTELQEITKNDRIVFIAASIINGKKFISQEILEQLSFRIPFSSHLSASTIEIVGILPPEVGDLAILPENLMVQKGFDYDVDKEYTYVRTFRLDRDGNAIVYDDEFEQKDKSKPLSNSVKRVKRNTLFNRMFNIYDSIMSNPDSTVQQKVNKALSMEKIKLSSNQIANATEQGKQEYMDLYNTNRNLFTRRKGSVGRVAIGAYSNAITLTGLMHAQPEGTFMFQYKGKDGMMLDSINFLGYEVGKLGRRQTLTNPDRSIIDVFMERQNAATDNVKVDALGRGGITEQTLNVDIIINLLGLNLIDVNTGNKTIPIEVSQLLFAQPLVKRYLHQKEKNKYKSNIEIIQELIENRKKQLENTNNIDNKSQKVTECDNLLNIINSIENLSDELDFYETLRSYILIDKTNGTEMYNNISAKENDLDFMKQLGFVSSYIWFDTKANQINDLQQSLALFSGGLGKSFIESATTEQIYNNILDGTDLSGKRTTMSSEDERFTAVSDAYKLFYDYQSDGTRKATYMGKILNYSLVTSRSIGSELFLPYTSSIQTMFKNINEMAAYGEPKYAKGQVERRTLILKEYLKYLASSARTNIYGKISPNQADNSLFIYRERGRLFVGSQNNPPLAAYLRNELSRQDKTGEYLRNNPLLSALLFEVNPGKPSFIKFDMASNSNISEANYYGSLPQLIRDNVLLSNKDGQEYTTRDLAYDLIAYAYLEGGFQEATQFVKYVPNQYLQEIGYSNYLSAIENILKNNTISERLSDAHLRFTIQFFQHNPQLLKSIDNLINKKSQDLFNDTDQDEFLDSIIEEEKSSDNSKIDYRLKNIKKVKDQIVSFELDSGIAYNDKLSVNMIRYKGNIYLAIGKNENDIIYVAIDKLGMHGMSEYQAEIFKAGNNLNYDYGIYNNALINEDSLQFGTTLIADQKSRFTLQRERKISQSVQDNITNLFINTMNLPVNQSIEHSELSKENDQFTKIISFIENKLDNIDSNKLSATKQKLFRNLQKNLYLLKQFANTDSNYKLSFVSINEINKEIQRINSDTELTKEQKESKIKSFNHLKRQLQGNKGFTRFNNNNVTVYVNLDAISQVKDYISDYENVSEDRTVTMYNDFLQTVVHETVHAITLDKLIKAIGVVEKNGIQQLKSNADGTINTNELANNTSQEVRELIEVYNEAKTQFNKRNDTRGTNTNNTYGFDSIDEFIAETLTNELFREELRKMKSKNKTLLSKLIDAILNVFGIKTGTLEYNAFISSFNLLNLNNNDINHNADLVAKRINFDMNITDILTRSETNDALAKELLFNKEEFINKNYESRWTSKLNINDFKCI